MAKKVDWAFVQGIMKFQWSFIQIGEHDEKDENVITRQLLLKKDELILTNVAWIDPILKYLTDEMKSHASEPSTKIKRVEFQVDNIDQIRRIAEACKTIPNIVLTIGIAADKKPRKKSAEKEEKRLSEFAETFYNECVDILNANLVFYENSRMRIRNGISNYRRVEVTIKTPIAMRAMLSVEPDEEGKPLKFNVIIELDSDGSDKTKIPKIELSSITSEASIETIQLMDENSSEQFLVEFADNFKQCRVETISAVVNAQLNISAALLDALLRSESVHRLLFRGIDKLPFKLVDGLRVVADATICYRAIKQTQPNGEKAVCLIVDVKKCPMYDII